METYNINKMVAKFSVLIAFLLLTGCSLLPHVLYKIDVQQGNVVTEEMLEKLKPGMTKSQVLFVLGSPLIMDAFRDNRWDYVYLFRKHGDLVEQKRVTLFFADDALSSIENYLTSSPDPIKPKPVQAKTEQKAGQKEMVPDDDDDLCNVPSTVSIKP
ncbi:outer membrane protein assembly factor BamE [Nitrosomonas sp.]